MNPESFTRNASICFFFFKKKAVEELEKTLTYKILATVMIICEDVRFIICWLEFRFRHIETFFLLKASF